jgi:flavodoxin I
MSKIAVVYWSAGGNTEAMAKEVSKGIEDNGAESEVIYVTDFSESMMDNYDAVAFGCPSMGSEELEDGEFEPVFEDCKAKLEGKNIALFGSYDWGDGEWMRTWEETCRDLGANMVSEGLICHLTPEEEGIEACRALGKALATA